MTNKELAERLRELRNFRAPTSETHHLQDSGYTRGWADCERVWRSKIAERGEHLEHKP